MRARTLGLAAAAGAATFLVVAAVASQALLPYVEFSVLVGIPVGVAAGALVAAFVLVWAGEGADPARRRVAAAVGAFGVAFLAAAGAAWYLGFGGTVALVAGAAAGVVVAAGTDVVGRLRA